MSYKDNAIFSYFIYKAAFITSLCLSIFVLWRYYVICLVVFLAFKAITTLLDRFIYGYIDPQKRAVFITGCDTGLGNRCARHLDSYGYIVFAGCLNKNSSGAQSLKTDCSSRLRIVEVNATKQKSIEDALSYIEKHLPNKGLWGVVNNAGMDMLGDVELTPVSLYEKCFELNLYGYIRVMKIFLPLIRQSKGRVINMSSVRGRVYEPCQGNYETAKHGIETLSDSLRLEMVKFGVKVIIIEPGDFSNATAIGSEPQIRRNQLEVDEIWESARSEVKQSYTKKGIDSWIQPPKGGWPPKADSTAVAKAVAHALSSEIPKHRYLVQGKWAKVPFDSWFLTYAHNWLPTFIVDKYMSYWKKDLVYPSTR
ncbi:D-beta-hydroxybutyrate dehydrogenase, mitochondrial-like [Ruditapes philippinarum]|uniref:D-beta-hydroxybutyrate dehydrogenase, mitochondrial-like n=1 Tax=Ruditapes philippinarum TaxID=129788 RepID=UPI00295B5D5A|nr:D-beta-hydroxybutyrate dehydrogenase, mitochondrial-like [Ruditapes philippinarum]